MYVAGAGPVGLAAAAAARILGAAVMLIGDMNRERLAHAKKVGFVPIDLSAHDRLGELVAEVLGVPEVDSAIDCVGSEAKGQGSDGHVIEAPAVVLAIPIIAVTAFATSGDEIKALESGCAAYITKPVNVDELLRTVESYLPSSFP